MTAAVVYTLSDAGVVYDLYPNRARAEARLDQYAEMWPQVKDTVEARHAEGRLILNGIGELMRVDRVEVQRFGYVVLHGPTWIEDPAISPVCQWGEPIQWGTTAIARFPIMEV